MDERADLGFCEDRVSNPESGDASSEAVEEGAFDIGVNVDALGRDADLAGVVVAAFDQGINDLVEVGAPVDDRRGSPAMFKGAARPRGELGAQMPADAARADESEEGDARIGRQLLGQLVVLKEGS